MTCVSISRSMVEGEGGYIGRRRRAQEVRRLVTEISVTCRIRLSICCSADLKDAGDR